MALYFDRHIFTRKIQNIPLPHSPEGGGRHGTKNRGVLGASIAISARSTGALPTMRSRADRVHGASCTHASAPPRPSSLLRTASCTLQLAPQLAPWCVAQTSDGWSSRPPAHGGEPDAAIAWHALGMRLRVGCMLPSRPSLPCPLARHSMWRTRAHTPLSLPSRDANLAGNRCPTASCCALP